MFKLNVSAVGWGHSFFSKMINIDDESIFLFLWKYRHIIHRQKGDLTINQTR